MFYHFSSQSIYFFVCVVVWYQHRLLSCVTPVFGCCFTIHGNCIFRLLIRRVVVVDHCHKTHLVTCYFVVRMYAPFLSPNLPKKELLKVIEKCLFAPSRIESLKDLSRSLGSIQQWMDPWKETSKKNMHIFSRLRTWLSIVMSHKCIEVVVALGTIFDEKKVTCG